MKSKTKYYTPGVCNINPKESRIRRSIAYCFFFLVFLWSIMSIIFLVHFSLVLITFVLLGVAVLNYLQARDNFCVMYAMKKEFNSSDKIAVTLSVSDTNSRKADSKKVVDIYVKSTFAAGCASFLHVILLILL